MGNIPVLILCGVCCNVNLSQADKPVNARDVGERDDAAAQTPVITDPAKERGANADTSNESMFPSWELTATIGSGIAAFVSICAAVYANRLARYANAGTIISHCSDRYAQLMRDLRQNAGAFHDSLVSGHTSDSSAKQLERWWMDYCDLLIEQFALYRLRLLDDKVFELWMTELVVLRFDPITEALCGQTADDEVTHKVIRSKVLSLQKVFFKHLKSIVPPNDPFVRFSEDLGEITENVELLEKGRKTGKMSAEDIGTFRACSVRQAIDRHRRLRVPIQPSWWRMWRARRVLKDAEERICEMKKEPENDDELRAAGPTEED